MRLRRCFVVSSIPIISVSYITYSTLIVLSTLILLSKKLIKGRWEKRFPTYKITYIVIFYRCDILLHGCKHVDLLFYKLFDSVITINNNVIKISNFRLFVKHFRIRLFFSYKISNSEININIFVLQIVGNIVL